MTNSIRLNHIGTVNLSGAEISDFDTKTQRLFVTGEAEGKPVLQVVDVSDPQHPKQINQIDLSSLGAGIQSVAVRKGTGTANSIVAVAISGNNITDPGKVAFYDAFTLTKISQVTVGALPDMITFTPDGSKLLVANEGEPNEDYTIDPQGSISIIDVSGDIASLDNTKVTTATFTAFNSQEATLKAEGVRIFGLNATVAQDLEPEYIAVSPDSKRAFITLQENNAIAILDIASGTITDIVPLGYKNHNLSGNGLDASDRDVNGTSAGGGKINIKNWPIFGMYQPDGISSFQINGTTYYITANEGDARIRPTANNSFGNEGSIFNEEARVSTLNLDPTVFPDATELKKPENLGRLIVTNKLGDTDGDGDFDQLYAYGGRSFSIWDDQGNLVFDSRDKLEQITAQKTPTLFNANNGSTNDRDTRSDNKGPEPESVVVGVIDGVPYGFIGLERAGGGVMVYNLSNPTAPEFVQYIRTPGDISPEGLKFIAAEDSPSNKPMLAVSHEVSNTVTLYEILPPPTLTNYEFQNLPLLGTTSAGQNIFLGGFSGLYFQGIADNGNLQFVTHTDRGPNGEPTGQNRPFLLPGFQPEIVIFELNKTTGEITITKRTGLFREDGTTPLTGRPNLQAGAGGTVYTDEIGVNLDGQILQNDPFGADLEGIVVAPNGDFWMVDEYRPAIYHFDVNGKLIARFIPQGTAAAVSQPEGTFGTEVLPVVYAQRRNNRGFEAVALEGNKLYAFIQSAIDNPDSSGDTTSRNSRNLRILEFDVVAKQVTGEYLYLLDDITGISNAKTDKIGDAVSLGNGKFAVVERDDLSNENSNKLIYQIDLAGATNINNLTVTFPAGKTTIEQLTEAELTTAGISVVSKKLIVNAAEVGYTGVEKLEGLALVDRKTLALVNDNDFSVGGTTIPIKLGILELSKNIVPQYGKIALAPNINNNIFTIRGVGETVRLKVILVSSTFNVVNELGIFSTDDNEGTIRRDDGISIKPGQEGYREAALERAKNQGKSVFSAIAKLPDLFRTEIQTNNLIRILEFDSDINFQFFLVRNGTIDGLRTGAISNSNVVFADFSTQSITQDNNSYILSWKDSSTIAELNSLVVRIESTDDPLEIGTTQQGGIQAEILDLTDPLLPSTVKANFSVFREAAFNNEVYFYKVDNAQGTIGTLTATAANRANYLQAAINNIITNSENGEIIKFAVDNQGKFTDSAIITTDSILAPMIVVNGTLSQLLDNNTGNDPLVYFPYLGLNNGVDHIRLLGDNIFGFEDFPGGGDLDYNDVMIRISFSTV